jgi:hypothetical protein
VEASALVRARVDLLAKGTCGNSHEEVARQSRALLIYEGWEGSVILTIEGEVLVETGGHLAPCEDPLRTVALVAGAERYPELKVLLPNRTDSARVCTACRGTGWFYIEDQKTGIRCGMCRALGWVSATV